MVQLIESTDILKVKADIWGESLKIPNPKITTLRKEGCSRILGDYINNSEDRLKQKPALIGIISKRIGRLHLLSEITTLRT